MRGGLQSALAVAGGSPSGAGMVFCALRAAVWVAGGTEYQVTGASFIACVLI